MRRIVPLLLALLVLALPVGAQQVSLATQGYGDALAPPTITATQNNYAPTGCERYILWRLTSDAARSITGISASACSPAPGTNRMRVLINDGSFKITLKRLDAGSSAANQYAGTADFVIVSGGTLAIVYDTTEQRWRPIGPDSESALNGGLSGSVVQTGVAVTLDFGTTNTEATTVVTGQTWVAPTTIIACGLTGFSTASRLEGDEDAILNKMAVQVSNISTGVGFTVKGYTGETTHGTYKIHCVGAI